MRSIGRTIRWVLVAPALATSALAQTDRPVPGQQLPFEIVREQIASELRQRSEARALSQYVRLLAGNAEIEGVELDAAESPLIQ